MKIIGLAILFGIMAPPVYADDWREYCDVIGNLAESIMKNRQNGTSMASVMKTASESKSSVVEVMEELVIIAYDIPRYSTENMQLITIGDFRDDVYLECVKVYRP